MKSLKGIESFVAVARSGSFTAAGKLLGVSAVAVSKNVATLERQLSVRLFQRTTRQLALTSEGDAFFRQCEAPLAELQLASVSVQRSNTLATGVVRVSCVSPIAMGYLVPMLPAFHKANPKVSVVLNLDNSVVDLVANTVDVGIRVGPLRDSSSVARRIAALPFVVCGSGKYLRQWGVPKSVDELRRHNCVKLSRDGQSANFPWFLAGLSPAGDKALQCNLTVNDFYALVLAAKSGQGLVCAPLPLVMPLFRSGQLHPVLTDCMDPKLALYLHYPNRKNLPLRTRAFVDFVLAALANEPDLQLPHQELLAPFVDLRLSPGLKAPTFA